MGRVSATELSSGLLHHAVEIRSNFLSHGFQLGEGLEVAAYDETAVPILATGPHIALALPISIGAKSSNFKADPRKTE